MVVALLRFVNKKNRTSSYGGPSWFWWYSLVALAHDTRSPPYIWSSFCNQEKSEDQEFTLVLVEDSQTYGGPSLLLSLWQVILHTKIASLYQ